jgi:hypothetical protein
MCGIADFYLEWRWDVNAVVQTDFRRGEFVDKRDKYISEIIDPLQGGEEAAFRLTRSLHDEFSSGTEHDRKKMCSWNVAVGVV